MYSNFDSKSSAFLRFFLSTHTKKERNSTNAGSIMLNFKGFPQKIWFPGDLYLIQSPGKSDAFASARIFIIALRFSFKKLF